MPPRARVGPPGPGRTCCPQWPFKPTRAEGSSRPVVATCSPKVPLTPIRGEGGQGSEGRVTVLRLSSRSGAGTTTGLSEGSRAHEAEATAKATSMAGHGHLPTWPPMATWPTSGSTSGLRSHNRGTKMPESGPQRDRPRRQERRDRPRPGAMATAVLPWPAMAKDEGPKGDV